MSYTQRFRETVSGSVSVSVDYPPSERGGTTYGVGHWSESIDIAIHVDTGPFDHSVSGVKQNVELLTGAVVATGAAHAVTKNQAAAKISETIINGFFGTIRSEIKQQMIEVQSLLAPKLQELKALAVRCKAVEEQMEADFRRITGRYSQLFGDLDQELKRRIGNLDQASFVLTGQATIATELMRAHRLSSVPSMTAKEKEDASSTLLLSALKRHALDMIIEGQDFILQDNELSRSLSALLVPGHLEARITLAIPVVVAVFDGINSKDELREVHRPGGQEMNDSAGWRNLVADSNAWQSLLGSNEFLVGDYLDRRLQRSMEDMEQDEVEIRLAAEMRRLWSQWRNQ